MEETMKLMAKAKEETGKVFSKYILSSIGDSKAMNQGVYFLIWVFKVFWSDGRTSQRSCWTQRKSQKYWCKSPKAAPNEKVFDRQTQGRACQTSEVTFY